MNGAEHKIEFVPILLHPLATSRGSFRIVVELNASANFHVRVLRAQRLDLIEIDAGVVAIVIGESDIAQAFGARRIHPRL